MRKAVFLDRDGVINIFPGPDRFVLSWADFHFMPGVRAQLRRLREAGYFLSLATNQSGVGRGLMTQAALDEIHTNMQHALQTEALDAIYFCPHHPDDKCACRKPSPDMILRSCERHHLDPSQSFMIGDSGRDIEMGNTAGCRTILCRLPLVNREKLQPQYQPTHIAGVLEDAVNWILSVDGASLS